MVITAIGLLLGLVYFGYAYRRKKSFLESPLPLTVREVCHYGERHVSLTLQRPDRSQLPPWTPGSHLVVNMEAPSGKYRRAYSIVDGDKDFWEIIIAAQPGGIVSNRLHELAVGALIHVQPPRGRFFKLQRSKTRQVCLIGAGAGVSPLIPMARQALHQGYHVSLIHSVRYERELIKADELHTLADLNPNFRYTPVVTGKICETLQASEGRINPSALQRWGLGHFTGEIYLCGSSDFVEQQASNLRQIGCQGKIIKEAFTGSRGKILAKIQVGSRHFAQGHSATLLAACEENGVLPFAECRTGHCLNCRATLQSGEVSYLSSSENRPRLRENEILPCICIPKSDIVLRFPSVKVRS